jgi:hypothetical protein
VAVVKIKPERNPRRGKKRETLRDRVLERNRKEEGQKKVTRTIRDIHRQQEEEEEGMEGRWQTDSTVPLGQRRGSQVERQGWS